MHPNQFFELSYRFRSRPAATATTTMTAGLQSYYIFHRRECARERNVSLRIALCSLADASAVQSSQPPQPGAPPVR